MPEYFWQNKLYHERKMFHWCFLCRNASLVCSTVARQSLLIIFTTVLQSAVTQAKPNPVDPFKKYRPETWVWKGTVQVSSFSHKTRFVLSRNYLFLLVSIISYNWGLLIPCSAHFNGNSDTIHHILFNLECNHEVACRDLSLIGERKTSLQNLRGNWLGIGQSWSSRLELRDINPISAEIVQITEIRPLVLGDHTCFRDCSEQLNSRGADASGEAAVFAQGNRTLHWVFRLCERSFTMLGNMHSLSWGSPSSITSWLLLCVYSAYAETFE